MREDLDDRTLKAIVAMLCLTALEVTNLLTAKIDAAVWGLIVAAIAGLGGYAAGRKRR